MNNLGNRQGADAPPAGAIPRPSWEYAQEPFDPSLTFMQDGQRTRHMDTPLDERYVTEPFDRFAVGSIPPEEREVRDHVIASALMRSRVTTLEFWWSQFVRQTDNYRASLEAFTKLEALCSRSREHRAAFIRMGNGETLPKFIRAELLRMVARTDARPNAGR